MIVIVLVNVFLIAVAIAILSGKGDGLIAGYNTAGKEEKQKVNVQRLRRVVAGILFLTAVLLSMPLLIGKEDVAMAHIVSAVGIIAVVVIGVLMANTWCIKK